MNVEIWQKSLSSITYISKKYALIIPLFSTENVEIWDEKHLDIPTILFYEKCSKPYLLLDDIV